MNQVHVDSNGQTISPHIMKILESSLSKGSIHIASDVGLLFCARFLAQDKGDIIGVSSDRGLNHLITLLAAAVLNNDGLKNLADKKYPHSLSVTSRCSLERSLRHSYLEMFLDENVFTVRVVAVSSPPGGLPGVYRRIGRNEVLLHQAFVDALQATPHRMSA